MQSGTAPVIHQNNFNLIRMVAALLVLFSHSFPLSTGDSLTEPLRLSLGVTWGSIAVDIFFVTSGYLVTASISRGGGAISFIVNRCLRIFPGLLASLIITTIVCSIWFTTLPFLSFWAHPDTWKYLIRNFLLLLPQGISWTLPGTLMNVPSSTGTGGALNGSLWTLPVELKMYILLLMAYITSRAVSNRIRSGNFHPKILFTPLLRVVAAIATIMDILNSARGHHALLTHMFTMFAVGSAVWTFHLDFSRFWPWGGAALLAVIVASTEGSEVFIPVYTIGLPLIILSAAYAPTPVLYRYNRIGDYSYGAYIYAYPVQQWCAALNVGITPWEMSAWCIGPVLLLAALSWHLIEKQALKLKYR